ncbi:hypothetical protein AB205_0202490 [Aquarana catesbeiana]|uniref:Uncharacterized protein n=1 Tax=Aquarana catesbeiana TaxID=8400 RepID=A0A2G9QL48_AQUCT|nr:hypothetical protein AB205_0202490 [Aquarana catesbeiana]
MRSVRPAVKPMASFGWKRKIGEKVSKVTSQNFEKESAGEGGTFKKDDVDWLRSVKRKKGILLEDNVTKSKRLKDEGALLALNGRSCMGRIPNKFSFGNQNFWIFHLEIRLTKPLTT